MFRVTAVGVRFPCPPLNGELKRNWLTATVLKTVSAKTDLRVRVLHSPPNGTDGKWVEITGL